MVFTGALLHLKRASQSLLLIALAFASLTSLADFTGDYRDSLWTLKLYGGDGIAEWDPDTLCLDSGYTGSGTLAQADITVRIPQAGTVYCEWQFYGGTAVGHRLSWLRNGTPTMLANRLDYAEGTNRFTVAVGDVVGFRVTAPKDDLSSYAEVFNFFAPGQEPLIFVHPTNRAGCFGSTISFDVTTRHAAEYQWQFKGQNMAQQTFEDLEITALPPADSGSYRVVVKNPLGSVTSSPAQLTIQHPPSLMGQPASAISRRVGESVTLSATATGTNLQYQWHRDGAAIPAATFPTLALTNLALTDAGQYSVAISNECGNVQSSGTALTVISTTGILTIVRGTNDTVKVQVVDAQPPFAIEGSNDLVQWATMRTNLADSSTSVEEPARTGTRFFRVRRLP